MKVIFYEYGIDKDSPKKSNFNREKVGGKMVEIDDQFSDCVFIDFDGNGNFNPQKYHTRKQKQQQLLKIEELKTKLKDTDYIALKAFEGSISEAEFEPIKKQREEWRKEVDALLKTI